MNQAEPEVGKGDLRYGPATAELKELLDRAVHTTGEQRAALDDADRLTSAPDASRMLRMARDYSWTSFHTEVRRRGLRAEFEALCADVTSSLGDDPWRHPSRTRWEQCCWAQSRMVASSRCPTGTP